MTRLGKQVEEPLVKKVRTIELEAGGWGVDRNVAGPPFALVTLGTVRWDVEEVTPLTPWPSDPEFISIPGSWLLGCPI